MRPGMRCLLILSLVGVVAGGTRVRADEGDKKEEPFVGKVKQRLPICKFHPFNVNGPRDGYYHNLVCKLGLNPVVLVFARFPLDKNYQELLGTVETALEEHKSLGLAGFTVLLALKEEDRKDDKPNPQVLAADLKERESRIKEVRGWAGRYKNLTVALDTVNGPKEYNISPEATVYVLLYNKFIVQASYKVNKGEDLTPEMIKTIKDGIDKMIADTRKKDEVKKK